jgi:N-acetylglucosaminyldiphosphoundecaprenol N-acetyl-beta-D-mannosaminyltransferase
MLSAPFCGHLQIDTEWRMPDHVTIGGVRVDGVDHATLESVISGIIDRKEKQYLAHVNIHAINLARRDETFRAVLNRAPLVYCDGEGVRLGARILGVRLPPRIVLTYWVWDLCRLCAERGYTVFFLGGSLGAAEEAAQNVRHRYPGIRIVGTFNGYFQKEGEESEHVLRLIRETRPQLLFVCFGMPLQEHWVSRNFDRIEANVILFGGSTIEYTARRRSLAPSWMANNGLEWMYRLVQEPRRLWKRYLIGNPGFLARILWQRLTEGSQG